MLAFTEAIAMKTNPFVHWKASIRLAAAALLVSALPARAEEPSLQDLLRDGLYAEEVTRDAEAAARQYQQVLTRHAEQNAIAATAIFRLAEVRRKQDRKDEAIKLYQQLLTEFPQIEPQAKLARENLAAMGGKQPEAAAGPPENDETKALTRLQKLARTSPDLALKPDELDLAVTKNWPAVVKFLLGSGMQADWPKILVDAARKGQLEVVEFLLESAKDKVADGRAKALAVAAAGGHAKVVSTLLATGADPNWQPDTPAAYEGIPDHELDGTALITAITRNYQAVVDLLLKANANVKLASTLTGNTPLHIASRSARPHASALVERLIKLGADVNATLQLPPKEGRDLDVTPLECALANNALESAKLLIGHGANVKQAALLEHMIYYYADQYGDDPALLFLLEAGADPNQRENDGKTPLSRVIATGNTDLLKLFLEHGADPNLASGTLKIFRGAGHGDPFAETTGKYEEYPCPPLEAASSTETKANFEMIRLLLKAGAKPGPGLGYLIDTVAKQDKTGETVRELLAFRPKTLNLSELPNMSDWKPAARDIFLSEVVLPALAGGPGVRLFVASTGKWQDLIESEAGKPLPATAELLLSHFKDLLPGGQSRLEQINDPNGGRSYSYRDGITWPALTRVRHDTDGKWLREKFDLTGDGPLPALHAGDVLELGSDGEVVRESTGRTAMEAKLSWHLRKRIAFPVTIEIDGKSSELVLRGDLLVFDPAKSEVPLVAAGQLARWFAGDVDSHFDDNTQSLSVRRKGWNDLRMQFNSAMAEGFQLQSGDELVLPSAKDWLDRKLNGGHWAKLVIPGLPFTRTYGDEWIPSPEAAQTNHDALLLPTLLQAIADVYAAWPGDIPDGLSGDDADLFVRFAAGPVPVVPSHPDFSKIRIRRLGQDGKENVLAIDLTDAISRCTDATPPAEAAKADVMLQEGDIVELPLHQDRLGQPWTGWSPAEARFFHQALAGNLLITRSSGKIEQMAINYQPPAWRATPHGLLPLSSAQGFSNLRVGRMVAGANSIKRADNDFAWRSGDDPFVRDGDQVAARDTPRQVAVPGVPPPSVPIPPMPRVVPPPSTPSNSGRGVPSRITPSNPTRGGR